MKIHLDMCALKRPFDDQSQARVWLESQAVIRVLVACGDGSIQACNSAALEFENVQNPNPRRRARAAALPTSFGPPEAAGAQHFQRAEQVQAMGFGGLDSLHLAFAQEMDADYFVTTDDQLLKRSRSVALNVMVISPTALVSLL